MSVLESVEDRLNRLGMKLLEWWAWPAAMVAVAVVVLALSWLYVPHPDETVTVLGRQAFPPCGVLAETGVPCGQCGMTRSWVWAARGQWLRALQYSASGMLLWAWLVGGGVVGGVRLVRHDPEFLKWPWRALGGATLTWLAVYFVTYGLRVQGYLPLPGVGPE